MLFANMIAWLYDSHANKLLIRDIYFELEEHGC